MCVYWPCIFNVPRYLAIIHYTFKTLHFCFLAVLYYTFEIAIKRWKEKDRDWQEEKKQLKKKQTYCQFPANNSSFSSHDIRKHFRGVYAFISLFFFSRTSTAYVTYALDHRSKDSKGSRGSRALTSVKNIDIVGTTIARLLVQNWISQQLLGSYDLFTADDIVPRSRMIGEWTTAPDERQSSYTDGQPLPDMDGPRGLSVPSGSGDPSPAFEQTNSNDVNATERKIHATNCRVEGRDTNHRKWR